MKYNKFIPQNIAPLGQKKIGVYNRYGNRVGQVPLGGLKPPDITKKKYSFGAISDAHITYTTGESDLINALNYFKNEAGVEFVCISGDLASSGIDSDLSKYKNIIDTNFPNFPIYVSAGNHDAYDADWNLRADTVVSASMQIYTGNPLYYSFEKGNDVFIFVGVCSGTFSRAELQWLYETLEANRNKRCFLFEHVFAFEGCGNVFGLYTYDLTNNIMFNVFKSLLRHYHNIIWFHGHSHTMFHGQEFGPMANYDKVFGCHSVHVPSCAIPRTDADGDYDFQIEYQESEGYLVDVYENGIHLRGRDFVDKQFLPIASYWLDTTLKEIPEKTYVDSTGTIDTNLTPEEPEEVWYTNVIPLSVNIDGSDYVGANGEDGYKKDTRWSSTTAEEISYQGLDITGYIPARRLDTLYFKNINTIVSDDNNIDLIMYDANFIPLRGDNLNSLQNSAVSHLYENVVIDPTTNYITQVTLRDKYDEMLTYDGGYVRLVVPSITNKSVITINENITNNPTNDYVNVRWLEGVKLSKTDNTYTIVSTDHTTQTSTYFASPYIPIEENMKYIVGFTVPSYKLMSICVFDKDDNLIEYQADVIGVWGEHEEVTVTHEIVFPTNATKFRLRVSTAINANNPLRRKLVQAFIKRQSIQDPGGDEPVPSYFTITNNLTNVTNNNTTTSIEEGKPYTATLTPTGTSINSVTVTMGGVDITSSAYSNGVISIASVTGDIVITAVSEAIVNYINQIPLSVTSTGEQYVGANGEDGYSVGYRINSSGVEVAQSGVTTTGFIPVEPSDILYFYNVNLNGIVDANKYCRINLYDENFAFIFSSDARGIYASKDSKQVKSEGISFDENGMLFSASAVGLRYWHGSSVKNVRYIRVASTNMGSDAIITKNKPITDAPPVNLLTVAIESDGMLYNGGQGWKTNTRLNSSGVESTSNAIGMEVTGFMPVKFGDKIYLKNIQMINQGTNAERSYLTFYDSTFTRLGHWQASSTPFYTMTKDENNYMASFMICENNGIGQDLTNVAYFRFSADEINSNSIVTVNGTADWE